MRFLEWVGHALVAPMEEAGRHVIMLIKAILWTFRPPFRLRLIIEQMKFIGVESLPVVILTGSFTGMVLALQGSYVFTRFNAESLIGVSVALSLTRELGPVLTGILVTGRAGSAMAAQLGTMRVTEQIDALHAMAVDPISYLVVPRLLASIVMLPALTVIFNFMGILGGLFVGIKVVGVTYGAMMSPIVEITDFYDLAHGLYKATFFGLFLSLIGCCKGYHAARGAVGVGRATTEAVVLSSVTILISDYFLTDLLF